MGLYNVRVLGVTKNTGTSYENIFYRISQERAAAIESWAHQNLREHFFFDILDAESLCDLEEDDGM